MSVQGLTPNSFYNMQLNAGAFFEDVDFSTASNSTTVASIIKTAVADGKCLGATSGGGSFQATPETRQIEADGMRYPIIGSTVIDSWEIKLTTTLKEITKQNFRRALATSEIDSATGAIKIRTNIKPTDYITSLSWVGDLLDGRLVAIVLDNALNITGANFTFTDKGEGTLPVEFRAHQADLQNMEYAPCEIYFFDNLSLVPVTGISLDHSTLNMNVSDTSNLTASIVPSNATNQNLTWSSDDPSVATVDSLGEVTAIAIGNANITVAAAENPSINATCTITVS